jgi:hypothetical protein
MPRRTPPARRRQESVLARKRSDRLVEFVRRRKVSRLECLERLPDLFGNDSLFRALDQFVLRNWERQLTEAFEQARRRRARRLLAAGSSVWLYRHADPVPVRVEKATWFERRLSCEQHDRASHAQVRNIP